jgi:hypothetical protein
MSIRAGCPNGHPLRAGAQFCPQCGHAYVVVSPEYGDLGAQGPQRQKTVQRVLIFLTIATVIAIVAALVVLHDNGNSPAAATGGTATTGIPTTTPPVTSSTTNPSPPSSAPPETTATIPADYSATTYEGTSFSIAHPTGWVVSHIPEGGNLDTTFQPAASWNGWLVRVDEDPGSGGTLEAASDPVIAALERDPTYGLVSLTRITFAGVPALRWEFEDTEEGVRLHKVDIFFIDVDGDGWGVLVEAPQSAWAQERAVLENYQGSFSDLATS